SQANTHRLDVNMLSAPPRPVRTKPLLVSVPDPTQEEQRMGVIKSFCGALGGALPDKAGACTSFPPSTLLAHTGTLAASGWFTTPVVVTLTAVNVNGKGIDHTEYSFDGRSW